MKDFEKEDAKNFYENVEELYDDFIIDESELDVVANDGKNLIVYRFKLFGIEIIEHSYYKFTNGISSVFRPSIYFDVKHKDILNGIAKSYNGRIDTPPYAEDDILEFVFFDEFQLIDFLWNELENVKELLD